MDMDALLIEINVTLDDAILHMAINQLSISIGTARQDACRILLPSVLDICIPQNCTASFSTEYRHVSYNIPSYRLGLDTP
jgi:hypothetical protein